MDRFALMVRAVCAALVFTSGFTSSTFAAEPVARFVAGLERHDLHEVALTYLEGLAVRTDLPASVRETLPLEQAGVHVGVARRSLDAETAERHLLAARERYTAFRAAQPKHPRGIEAGRQLGFVLAELGKRKAAQARRVRPAQATQRSQLEQGSRAYFAAALQQADVSVAELEARLKEMPLGK